MRMKNKRKKFSIALTIIISLIILLSFLNPINLKLDVFQPSMILHTSQAGIFDANGNVVLLRGVNFGGFGDNTGGTFNGAYSTINAQLSKIKAQGFNTVRVMIIADWWLNNFQGNIHWFPNETVLDRPDLSYPFFKNSVKTLIQAAYDNGLYVVISLWSADYDTVGGQIHYPVPSITFPSAQAYADFWVQFATEYSSFKNLIFEGYNEPNPQGSLNMPQCFIDNMLAFKTAISTLRSNRFNNLFIVQWGYSNGFNADPYGGGGASWVSQANSYFAGLTSVVYSAHIYRMSFGSSTTWTQEALTSYVKTGAIGVVSTLAFERPLLIGEIGCENGDLIAEKYYNWTLATLNEYKINYLAFTWSPDGLYGIVTGSLEQPTLNRYGKIYRVYALNMPTEPLPSSTANSTPFPTSMPTPTPSNSSGLYPTPTTMTEPVGAWYDLPVLREFIAFFKWLLIDWM
jgi:hypothetical protein